MSSNRVGTGRSDALALTRLCTLMRCGDESQRVWAAIAFGYLANEDCVEESGVDDLGADQDAINILLLVIQDSESPSCEKAIAALGCLSSTQSHFAHLILSERENDAVALLVNFMGAGTPSQREEAPRTLGYLANADCVSAEVVRSGGVKALVELIAFGSYQEMDVSEWTLRRLLAATRPSCTMCVVQAVQQASGVVWPKCMDRKDRQLVLEQLVLNCEERLNASPSPVTSPSSFSISSLVAVYMSGNACEKQEAMLALRGLAEVAHDIDSYTSAANDIGGVVNPLVQLMERGSDADRQEAAQIVGRLVVESVANRVVIVGAGALRVLVSLVILGTDSQQSSAFWALENLADINHNLQIACEIIERLAMLMEAGSATEKREAARQVGNLTETIDGLCEVVGSMPEVIPGLVTFLATSGSDDWEKGRAARSLGVLAAGSAKNRESMTGDARTIPALVSLVKNRAFYPMTWSVWPLGHFATRGTDKMRSAIVSSGAIPELVALLTMGNPVVSGRGRRGHWGVGWKEQLHASISCGRGSDSKARIDDVGAK